MAEIDSALRNANFDVVFLNKYFDTSDFLYPVKLSLDDRFFFKVIPTLRKSADVFIKHSIMWMYDSLIYQLQGYFHTIYYADHAREQIDDIT